MSWERLETAFADLLDQPPGQRRAWLEAHYAEEPELRAELAALLAGHESDSRLPTEPLIRRDAAERIDARWLGQTIGVWRIERLLGRGGMGAVYLARRADGQFEQSVAVKLADTFGDRQVVRALLRERQALAALQHPNITRILDGGETSEGIPYLVMEHVDGVPITDFATQQRLTTRQRLSLFIKVCRAVAFAHHRLVIHRDIKPTNVLVTADGQPKLLDFGIAKLLDTVGDAAQSETLDRVMSLDYASPEQILGEEITVASDVYSLGVLLYQLLTGSRPVEYGQRSISDVVRLARQDGHIEAPSRRAASERLADDLDTIVLCALSRDPRGRYGTVDQLIEDIERFLDGRPINARPRTWRYATAMFVRRHRWAVAASTVVSLSLIGLSLVAVYWAQVADRERDAALAASALSESALDFLLDTLDVGDEFNGRAITVPELLKRSADRAEEVFAVEPEIRGRILHGLGDALFSQDDLDGSRNVWKRAWQARRSELGPGHPDTLLSHTRYAYTVAQTDAQRGLVLAEEALALAEASLPPGHPMLRWTVGSAATMNSQANNHERADSLFKRAISLYDAAGDRECGALSMWLNNYWFLLRLQGRHEEGIAPAQAALEICADTANLNQRWVLHQNLGLGYHSAGKLDQARVHFELSQQAAAAGLSVRQQARSMHFLVNLYLEQGRTTAAGTMADELQALLEQHAADYSYCRYWMAVARARQALGADVDAVLEVILGLIRAADDELVRRQDWYSRDLAESLAELGRPSDAEALLARLASD